MKRARAIRFGLAIFVLTAIGRWVYIPTPRQARQDWRDFNEAWRQYSETKP